MWLTLQEVKKRFRVKDNRTITVKFVKEGLKFIKIGKQYRFDIKDIEEFENYLKNKQQEILIKKYPIKMKRYTERIDYNKRKINLTQMKVV